jgi:hypothetical protein
VPVETNCYARGVKEKVWVLKVLHLGHMCFSKEKKIQAEILNVPFNG